MTERARVAYADIVHRVSGAAIVVRSVYGKYIVHSIE